MAKRLRIAVLISGGGTTLANLLERNRAGQLDVEFVQVISSNSNARGLEHAADAAIATTVLERKNSSSDDDYSRRVFDVCRQSQAELIVMAGFLKFVPIPPDFENRVINIHPALIPAFCGAGMYGQHVHEGVLAYGAKVSGCTVHFVDNQYDHGPIILQHVVPVEDGDTPESLAARVFAAECEAYPAAICLFAAGRLRVEGRIVRVLPMAGR